MGLPMYREPDEVTIEENVAKIERAAAIRRSTIRRESTVRPRRHIPTSQRRELAELIPDSQQPHRSPFVDANDEIQHLEAELERLRRHRIFTQARRGAERDVGTVAPEDIALHARNLDSLANTLPRESALRFELGPPGPSRSGATSPRRHRISRDNWVNRRTLPSPPHSIESSGPVRAARRGRDIVPDGPLATASGFTSHFAPARGPYRATPQASEGMSRTVIEHNSHDSLESLPPALERRTDTPPPDTWEASYPTLRRVGHLSPLPGSSHDSLGDRRRSMSVGSPASAESLVNEDHWVTLLTTMDDNDLLHQPSFDSTRSNSEPDTNRSTQTAATSFGEIGSADDTCDLDLPPGINENDVRQIRELHRGTRSRTREVMSDRLGLSNDLRSQAQQAMTDRLRLSNELREVELRTDGEMAVFQSLLTRFAQRRDVPEAWLTAAGLTRTARENV